VRKADNLPPSCAVVTKSGNLHFLERSGPLRTGNGTDFNLRLYINVNVILQSFLCHLRKSTHINHGGIKNFEV